MEQGDAKIPPRFRGRDIRRNVVGPRINDQIRISPVRVIDQHNEQVGIIDTYRARQMAREAF
ncbi:MAG: hypothetical protein KAI25_12980, partial [Hyphomicrobiaceae bacterium]|nr:hypothetical protein [Hyphomicrobiaceae bacterium]